MSFGAGRQPQAPDPYVVADAQNRQNRDTASYNARINRMNTYTPFGSQEFNVTGYDPNGAPIYEQRVNMSPEQRDLYVRQLSNQRGQLDVANSALRRVNRGHMDLRGRPEMSTGVNVSGPEASGELNTSNLPGLPGQDDLAGFRDQQSDALYRQNTRYLDRDFDRREEQLRTRLANQGAVEGSEAYDNAMRDFTDTRERAYGGARDSAIAGGGAEASRMFGIGSQARGQLYGEALSGGQFANNARSQRFGESLAGAEFGNRARAQDLDERLTLENQPLQQFLALNTTGATMPSGTAPGQVGANPADIQGAMMEQYRGNLNNYNARVGSRNSLMNGLFGLGSAFLLSDENAKENIHEVGELHDGTGVYLFNYKGDHTPQMGVMAQEVEKKDPAAVKMGRDGYKRVNYARVAARALEAA